LKDSGKRACPNERAYVGADVVIEASFAVHESGNGPSRHIAPPRILGRKRGLSEVGFWALVRLEEYNLAVHRWQISDPFGGSDASWVDRAVCGDVVDLAARSTDIH
jgi:hypothetical protein